MLEINQLEIIEMSKDLKLKIEEFYQHLINSYFPFDALCWALAELELIFEKGSGKYSEKDVIKRAEKILSSDINYDTLCLLISRFKAYLEAIKLYP
ncbi:MAG: hypothetical protein ACFFDH_19875 [Promethearchaeota archaeon]